LFATFHLLRGKYIKQKKKEDKSFLAHRDGIASTTKTSFAWKEVYTQYFHA